MLKEALPSAFWGAATGALFGLMAGATPSAKLLAEAAGRTLAKQLTHILYCMKPKVFKDALWPIELGAVVGGFVGANGWYSARAMEFTHIGTNNEVVIGKQINNSPYSYDIVEKNRGSTYFGTSEARWTEVKNMFGVREKGMWRINKTFLKQQIATGKSFVLTADFHFGFLFKEISYIAAKGASIFLI